MAVTITHTLVNSITGASLFQVADTVTAATNIVTTVFVYDVGTSLYHHIASASDVQTFPNTRAAALIAGQPYYLQSSATLTFTSLAAAQAFDALIAEKFKSLCVEYLALQTGFVGTTTATVSS